MTRIRKPGILVYPKTGDPVTPTIVYTRGREDFWLFCSACRVRTDSRYICPVDENNDKARPLVAHLQNAMWKHVAFVGVSPLQSPDNPSVLAPYNYGDGYYSSSQNWADLERLRRAGIIERAFYYPKPDSAVPAYFDTGREWLNARLHPM
jgi:hypothetical protein